MWLCESVGPIEDRTKTSGAGGGSRTRTAFRPRDFKSPASAIPPPRRAACLVGASRLLVYVSRALRDTDASGGWAAARIVGAGRFSVQRRPSSEGLRLREDDLLGGIPLIGFERARGGQGLAVGREGPCFLHLDVHAGDRQRAVHHQVVALPLQRQRDLAVRALALL